MTRRQYKFIEWCQNKFITCNDNPVSEFIHNNCNRKNILDKLM